MLEFDNIIGYEAEKEELYQIVDLMQNYDLYQKMGASLCKGLLIYGKPGLGKTTMANALIQACNVPYFVIRKNKAESQTISEINDTFERASKIEPSVILIDDIDKFSDSDGQNVDDPAFVAIQSAIDSIKDKRILIIATANDIYKLPESLKRDGRFDRKMELEPPSHKDARKIIEHYLRSKNVSKDINYEDVAYMINYSSCANLETLINESAIYATRQRKDSIDIYDIMKTHLKNRDAVDVDEDEELGDLYEVCIHEAGHTVMSELIKEGSVGFVTVNSINDGYTQYCNPLARLTEGVLQLLGGKAASELFYSGGCAKGCKDDLTTAMSYLHEAILRDGICGLGQYQISSGRYGSMSDSSVQRSEDLVRPLMEQYFYQVKDILFRNREFVLKVADELKEKHNLFHSDIVRIRNSVKVVEINSDWKA